MKIPQRVSVASRAKLGNTRTHMALEAVPFVRLDMFNLNRKAHCVRSAMSVVTKTVLENRSAESAVQDSIKMSTGRVTAKIAKHRPLQTLPKVRKHALLVRLVSMQIRTATRARLAALASIKLAPAPLCAKNARAANSRTKRPRRAAKTAWRGVGESLLTDK